MRFKTAGAAALLLAIAMPMQAQQPPRFQNMPMPVELALRQKEQLKLTDAQVSQLEAIRKEIVAERQQRATQMIDVQSRIAAGLVKGEEVRKQFQGQRDAQQKTMEARRDRINKILTQEQQDQLRQHMRHFAMRRMQQRGMMGPQMMRPGMGRGMGRGMGPGMMPPRHPMPPQGPGFDQR